MAYGDIYEHIKFENSQIPFELYDFHFAAGESLGRRNWHESIEILYVTSGSSIITSNFQKISAQAGDIAVINTNTLHDIYAKTDMHFYCLIVDRAFCVSNFLDTNTVQFHTYVRDEQICALIQQFVDEYHTEFLCRAQLLRSTALRIVALLRGKYAKEEVTQEHRSPIFDGIKKVLGHIHSQSHTKITLDELAKIAGISKFYLAREFRNMVGCTIIEYINHTRCENAKRMLQENQISIAAIAMSCGYSNPSYFTKTFLAHTGMHPSEYREQFRSQHRQEIFGKV